MIIIKKGCIAPAIAQLVTVVALILTSRAMIPSGDQLPSVLGFTRLVVITFLAFVGWCLWCSILSVVIILPLAKLIRHNKRTPAQDEGENISVLLFLAVSAVLIWIQFYLFGNGLPFVLMH